jgi:hypothetical protein
MRELHIFHDPDAKPQEWRVEEIDSDGDGGCDVVIFTGPHGRAARQAVSRPAPEPHGLTKAGRKKPRARLSVC